jgi:uncharacterized protein involved in exopolysaccharide biosynthesis
MMADEVRVGENLAKLVGVWERRKWLAILGFAAAFAISATVTFALPNVYQSAAMVMVDRQPPFLYPPLPPLSTLSQKILSRPRLDQLIHQFDLYPTERAKLSADALVERMRQDIEVKPIGHYERSLIILAKLDGVGGPGSTTFFTVKYRGPGPATVAQVANALASYYVNYVDEYTEFSLLEPAVPATTPSTPNRPLLLLLSLALSTGLAISLVLLAEQFDTPFTRSRSS